MTSADPDTLAPVFDLAHLPYILKVPDMAALLRTSIGTIRRDLQRGTFLPKPFHTRPYKWQRPAVVAYLESLSDTPQRPPLATIQPTRRRSRG